MALAVSRETDHQPALDIHTERMHWDLACTAITLLRQDARALKGILAGGSHGPVHQAYQTLLAESFAITRIPVNVSEERLCGGLDIGETLSRQTPVRQPGLLDTATGVLLVNGAERLDTTTAGILSNAIDAQGPGATACAALVAFDESLPDEPGLSQSALGDRLALMFQLPDLPLQALQDALEHPDHPQCQAAAADDATIAEAIGGVSIPDEMLMELLQLADRLGIESMRPVLHAARVARGHAYLNQRSEADIEDAIVATQLVLAPRAMQLPQSQTETAEPEPDPEPAPEDTEQTQEQAPDTPASSTPDTPEQHQDDHSELTADNAAEQLIEAATACLPQHLIAALARGQTSANARGRDTQATTTGTLGRPAGVRRPRGNALRQRLNILETLKCAAPKQRLRGQFSDTGQSEQRLQVRLEDFRITRFRQPTRTTTVFLVDASGSAALHRLAEAKGAIELLLAECYVRRDRVAMISFKGTGACLELPPTRSLVRAKRRLAGLPGGGATPLAAGLDLTVEVVRQLKQAGETPVVVIMTDGKANMARDGEASRAQAMKDAEQAARQLAVQSIRAMFIDTSPRARPQAAQLASLMQAQYLPLPPGGARKVPALLAST